MTMTETAPVVKGLEPCPFCGSKSLIPYFTADARNTVLCDDCGAEGPSTKDTDEAMAAWNCRSAGLIAPHPDQTSPMTVGVEAFLDEPSTLSPAAEREREGVERPEDTAEQFIQAAIDNGPEPLRRLGEWLANKLDDDDWKTADRLITGAAVTHAEAVAQFVRASDTANAAREKAEAERDEARADVRKLRRAIQNTHKNAVKHDNCETVHCMICDGGLFMCADCGAAEIEAEERVCTSRTLAALSARVREVLEPFASFGRDNVDADGWAGLRCEHERINVWFGPSEFRAARALYEEIGGGND